MKESFFPHRRVKSRDLGEVVIPIAKILLYGSKAVSLDVIVDSGAVISLFPKSVCSLIGLEFLRKEIKPKNCYRRINSYQNS